MYGVAITELHSALRLCALVNKPDYLVRELQNIGHQSWNLGDNPESLLLEVENRILIREV